MSEWSLAQLLHGLHEDIEHRLEVARKSFAHPGTKGDVSEGIWRALLEGYLPKRYDVATAHVVDSNGSFSEQLDVVIFDRQYSPLVFKQEGQLIIPAESVYAVFEAKQSINAANVGYAQTKISSVRRLLRTSLPIPSAGGILEAKVPPPILGGFLSFESDWSPALGTPLLEALESGDSEGIVDLGCIAAHGTFERDLQGGYSIKEKGKPATAFLLELIARLQGSATVAMIDIRAYARWLT